MFRKVIKITAEDTPNVKYALAQHKKGLTPTGTGTDGVPIFPGVLTWKEYCERRTTWDKIRQTIGLDAKFYEGHEVMLFPEERLNRAERYAAELRERGVKRKAKAIGCDPGEGGSKSAWCVGDEHGIIGLFSRATPDTTIIPAFTLELMDRFGVPAENVLFDRGGGGKQHADIMRKRGYDVNTIGFGEPAVADQPEDSFSGVSPGTRKHVREVRYQYCNMRAQMYGEAAELLDPSRNLIVDDEKSVGYDGFAIPAGIAGDNSDPTTNLKTQLLPIPLWYNAEQRIFLPPKRSVGAKEGRKVTMYSLIGHSPDEADAFVLMVHRLLHRNEVLVAGYVRRNRS